MPIVKRMKGLPQDFVAAKGVMSMDWQAITPCQRECTTRFAIELQRDQEEYIKKHPEILAMLKIFIAKKTERAKRKDFAKDIALYFTRPFAEMDEEIRIFLESPKSGPYVNMEDRVFHEFNEEELVRDLKSIIEKHYPPVPWSVPVTPVSLANTESSSFISIQTSEITLPTPEPVPTPEPTISEIFYNLISNTVDKVIFGQVDERAINYDTAYVEMMKAVEAAMEIPVKEIRLDIADLFNKAYRYFGIIIAEKERIAAAHAWENRMRKKLKRTMRRQKNFKGYETPPTPRSEVSSHESYKRPPPRPCECQPLANYNRYGKDRFGIYLPREEKFSKENITTTPACSMGMADTTDLDTKSTISKKSFTPSVASSKSAKPKSTN